MSYDETIQYLYNLQKHGIKFGLDNITRLLSRLNNPHESFLSVHVAGTNGKGSTSAIIASILQTAGFRVGLFTSPHLVSFTERIRVNGDEISESEVVRLAGEIEDISSHIDDFSPTFFEVVTAMALLYFVRKKIDIAIMEVGMGGRLDATNIILPEVSVITSIGYDHKEFLGFSLGEIAFEKAGIIKNGVPVVVSHQESEVKKVIEKKAIEKNADFYMYGQDFSSVVERQDVSGIWFDYRDGGSVMLDDLFLPLAGEHQMQNASVAIKAAMIVLGRNSPLEKGDKGGCEAQNKEESKKQPPPPPLLRGNASSRHQRFPFKTATVGDSEITNQVLQEDKYVVHHFIREGLKKVKWPGRLEFIREDPPVLIDGAHNPAAAEALSHALKNLFLEKYRIILILGIMDDKDISGVMQPLLPLASEIILTSPSYTRAASPEKLAGIAAALGYSNIRTVPTLKGAVESAVRIDSGAGSQDPVISDPVIPLPLAPCSQPLILVTGSFYTAGEAKEILGQKGVLTRLRE
jgi:folylpolyglutamate synthase/dihydropteroate synthase